MIKSLFSRNINPEKVTRDALRKHKWSVAISSYEKKLQENPKDFALWNLLGDLHLNNKSQARAVEAWRRALDGYTQEGLHENVLGIARKLLRCVPAEEDVHLLIAEACLGLEYHADCLSAVRNYLKLAKHPSEMDLRGIFKKLVESSIRHPHLLEELKALFRDARIEDIELERRLNHFTERHGTTREREAAMPLAADDEIPRLSATPTMNTLDGLMGLDDSPAAAADEPPALYHAPATPLIPTEPREPVPVFEQDFETPVEEPLPQLPEGEGKDHYDLGLVYKDMKLWDAAITELEQARRDPSIRVRATLAMAECLQEMYNLEGALDLLEREQGNSECSEHELLSVNLRIGCIYELLGNLNRALEHYEVVQTKNPAYGDVENRVSELRLRLQEQGAEHNLASE